MLHFRQALGRGRNPAQALTVKLVGRGPRRASIERRPDRDGVVFFSNILMDSVVGKACKREPAAGEQNLDFLRRRKLFDSFENLASFILS
jgi:hypothetical protein